MSGSFVSQDGKTHSHAGWHTTPHTRSQTRQAEKCARFTGYAVDPVPAGAQDALRGRKQLAAQPYLPQNVRAPSAASATHASKRSRQHAASSSSARDCSARRRYPAQARRTYAIWPELRPQDRRVDRNFFLCMATDAMTFTAKAYLHGQRGESGRDGQAPNPAEFHATIVARSPAVVKRKAAL